MFSTRNLRPGNRVLVTRQDRSIAVFEITGVRRYAKVRFPTQLVYGNTNHAALRLIACGGSFDFSTGHYVDNVVVFAISRRSGARTAPPRGLTSVDRRAVLPNDPGIRRERRSLPSTRYPPFGGQEASPGVALRSAFGPAEGRGVEQGRLSVVPRGGMVSKRRFSVGRPLVWVGVAVLSAGLAVGAWYLKSTGIEDGVKAANRVAASTVKKQLAPSLTSSDIAEPMSEEASADLQQVVSDRILDEHTSTVRIWATDGTLIYSSTGEPTGTHGGNERGIRLATDGEGKTTSIVPASELGVLDIYTPLRLGGEPGVGGSRRGRSVVRADLRRPPASRGTSCSPIAGGLAAIVARDDRRLVRVPASGTVRQAGRDGLRPSRRLRGRGEAAADDRSAR